jgi:hypothetical protein
MRAVKSANEILSDGPTEGGSRVDGDEHDVFGFIAVSGILHAHLNHVWALVLQTSDTIVGEVACRCPVDEVGARKNANLEVDRIRHDHDPALGWFVPDNLWISELRGVGTAGYDNRVVLVLGEGVAVVVGVSNVLSLVLGDIDGVDGDYAVGLVWEEPTSVVVIDYG